jgi:uncharacterized membrane protein
MMSTRLTHLVATISLLAIVVLGLAWELWLAPLRSGGSWWVLKVLPLLPAVFGLLKNRLYTYRWVSLLVWLYVMEGSVRATSDRGLSQWLAAAQVVLSLLLFTACAVHVRLWLRQSRPAPNLPPS